MQNYEWPLFFFKDMSKVVPKALTRFSWRWRPELLFSVLLVADLLSSHSFKFFMALERDREEVIAVAVARAEGRRHYWGCCWGLNSKLMGDGGGKALMEPRST